MGLWVRLVWVTLGSALLGLIGISACLFLGHSPFTRDAWLDTAGLESIFVSILLGGCIAGITILSSRLVVKRFAWARALHGALRPAFADQRDGALVLMAVASGVGEGLFFPGLLSPVIRLLPSRLAFRFLHPVG